VKIKAWLGKRGRRRQWNRCRGRRQWERGGRWRGWEWEGGIQVKSISV